ncbi:MAG: hypothetical protein ACLSS8_07095 [Oscillospiraceae bacterium]
MVCIEVSDNVCHGVAAGIHLENLLNNRGGVRVNLNMFFTVNSKAQCQIAACGEAFFSIDVHTAPYFL